MKKELASVVFASVLLGATSFAFAGAYGEKADAEEIPAPVAVAPAVPEPEPEAGYWYLQAGAEYSFENFSHGSAHNAWGYNLRAGRRLCDMFAVEAEWEHLPGDFEEYTRRGRGTSDDVEAWNITANGKFYPVKGRFQPFALVGVGYSQENLPGDNNGGMLARFGLGLDVLVTDNIGVALESDYLLGIGAVSRFDQIPVSLGVFYNFL